MLEFAFVVNKLFSTVLSTLGLLSPETWLPTAPKVHPNWASLSAPPPLFQIHVSRWNRKQEMAIWERIIDILLTGAASGPLHCFFDLVGKISLFRIAVVHVREG